ncbi:MAG: DUF4131 domain-containing protein, partial [Candidatus Omnitrophica bacterium]|nr:DUF4131 domain-containing protein [Candidatus Omnitrophota bacterium]
MKRPILYIVIPFCIGIALACFFNADTSRLGCIPNLGFSISSLALILLAAVFHRNNILSHIFLYIALMFFGIAYCQNYSILPKNHIANFISEENPRVAIKGIITDDPFTKKAFYGKEKTSFTLEANAMNFSPGLGNDYYWQKVTGLVKVDLYSDEEIKN